MAYAKRPNILYADKVERSYDTVAAIAASTTCPLGTMDGDYRLEKFELEIQGGYVQDASNYYDVTIQARPTVFTAAIATDILTCATAHGCTTGDAVRLVTTGTLPTGIVIATTYFAIVLSATTMKLATTRSNALAGTAIDLTGSDSTATCTLTSVLAIWSFLTGAQGTLATLVFGTGVLSTSPQTGLSGDPLWLVFTKFGTGANIPANSRFVAHLKQLTNV